MIYFFNSTNKRDKLTAPITVITSNERRAYALAVLNFAKHGMVGSPKRINV